MRNEILQKLDAGINAAEQTGISLTKVELHPDTLEAFWNNMVTFARVECEVNTRKLDGQYKEVPLKSNSRVPENRLSFIFPYDEDLQAWEELVDDWTKSS